VFSFPHCPAAPATGFVRCTRWRRAGVRCYTFPASLGRFAKAILSEDCPQVRRVHDPIAASRRNIARAAAIQALVVMVAALICLPFTGAAWAAGVVAGGGGLALGGWLAGRIA